MPIVLASQSPRRVSLLKKIVKDFIVNPANINEENIAVNKPIDFAVYAAILKAKTAAKRFPQSIIIGADTIVVLGKKIFGKPKNKQEAKRMLSSLSGREHEVITGVALYRKKDNKLITASQITRVTFKKLTLKNIEDYLNREDFKDKAGSYAIQDTFDSFIEKIDGDYDNVVGLPIDLVKTLLVSFA